MIDTAALRLLCEKATSGPWKHWEDSAVRWDDPLACGFDSRERSHAAPYYCTGPACLTSEQASTDAAFIAAARTAVPALLDSIADHESTIASLQQYAERVKAERDEARAECASRSSLDRRLDAVADALVPIGEKHTRLLAAARALRAAHIGSDYIKCLPTEMAELFAAVDALSGVEQ